MFFKITNLIWYTLIDQYHELHFTLMSSGLETWFLHEGFLAALELKWNLLLEDVFESNPDVMCPNASTRPPL